jgi:hypothetical protein
MIYLQRAAAFSFPGQQRVKIAFSRRGANDPRYRVAYPPLAKIVCPVIHQPSVAKNFTIGAMSFTSPSAPVRLADL